MALKSSTVDSLLEQLEDDGFVLLGRVLSEEDTAAARERLQSHLAHTITSLGGNTQEHERRGVFARIHTRQNRHDLCLKMTAENSALLRKVVSAKADVYRGALGNEATKAKLVEFGAITSHPGATQQTIHSDVEFCPEARKVISNKVFHSHNRTCRSLRHLSHSKISLKTWDQHYYGLVSKRHRPQ